MTDQRTSEAQDLPGLVSRELRILEQLVTPPGTSELSRRFPAHPVVVRTRHFEAFRGKGFIFGYPNELPLALELAGAFFDLSTWSSKVDLVDSSQFWSFAGSDNVRKFLQSRLQKPDSCDDALAALGVWGALSVNGVSIEMVEEEGMPDLRFTPNGHLPFWGEVKRIHVGTGSSRAGKVLEKANKQIKRATPTAAGVLYLSIQRDGTRASLDDRVPSDVKPYIAEIEQAFARGHFKSVARVIVVWDDFMLLGSPPEPTLYAFRRRSLVLNHPHPRNQVPLPNEELGFGRTATWVARWAAAASLPSVGPGPQTSGDFECSPLFREQNEVPEGLRAAHAFEAIQAPDAKVEEALDGTTIELVTRRVALTSSAFTLLVIATREPSGKHTIQAGFRLLDGYFNPDLSQDPIKALEAFVARYGADVVIGNIRSNFIRSAVVPASNAASNAISVLSPGDEPFALYALLKRGVDHVEARWVFAILTNGYRKDLRAAAAR